MKDYLMKVDLESPLLLGSGVGWGGTLIDTDIIFDDYGLPFFPARRLKGMLRESAVEVVEMFELSGIDWFNYADLDLIFGEEGSAKGALAGFYNLYLADYKEAVQWLEWAFTEYGSILMKEIVLDTFTEIRQQTAVNIEDGIAKENSLRTIRILNPGYIFTGFIQAREINERLTNLLALAAANLRHIGSKRTRGLGEVNCSFWKEGQNLSQEVLEQLKGEYIHA